MDEGRLCCGVSAAGVAMGGVMTFCCSVWQSIRVRLTLDKRFLFKIIRNGYASDTALKTLALS